MLRGAKRRIGKLGMEPYVFNERDRLEGGELNTLETQANGQVLAWSVDPSRDGHDHEVAAGRLLAERIAALKGYTYAGEVGSVPPPTGPVYFVPSDTITDCALARFAGIHGVDDLFGGVVPHPFVGTKAITHALIGDDAAAPEGWVPTVAQRVQSSVLTGYTAFSEADARLAGRDLLPRGSVRVKPARATGGRSQWVVRDALALDEVLAGLSTIARDGVVLERNLRNPRTLSVGQAIIGTTRMSYHGLQRLVRNHAGEFVYGGSELTVVRGDLEDLLGLQLEPALRLAIDQARLYHAVVVSSFDGFIASRINYDVAQGLDDTGRWCSGVLEPSWRVGGASAAEIAAMEVLHDDPDRMQVRSSCVEVYGGAEPPAGACVYYDDIDPAVGRITKFSFVEPHADPT